MRGSLDGSTPNSPVRNAFHPSFLDRVAEQDEPPFAAEAEAAGPWHIEEIKGRGFGLFRPGESLGRGIRPVAVCETLWLARLLAAILPGTGRDRAFRLNPKPDLEGYAVESRGDWARAVAWLELFNDDIPEALHVALCLVRSPESLKLLLAAAGGVSLELTGAGLDEMFPGEPEKPQR